MVLAIAAHAQQLDPGTAPAPDTSPPGQAAPPQEELVNLTISDAKLQDVLRSLVDLRPGVNIIMGSEVDGTIGLLTLRDVTWETALRLIAESCSLEVAKEGENIYRVRAPLPEEPVVEELVVVELLKPEDADNLSIDIIRRLLSRTEDVRVLAPDELRERLRTTCADYLRRLTVADQPAVDVVTTIATKAGLNFSYSPGRQIHVPREAEDKDGLDAPVKVQIPPLSLNLQFIPVVDALQLVAAQGGLSCINDNGVWVVSPLPPQQLQQEPLKLEAFEVKFIRLDDELVQLCKGLLVNKKGSVSRGKNKVLIVKDVAEGVESVRQALEVMDKPTPQVLIEARFFELSERNSEHLGIDWNALGESGVSVQGTPLLWDKTDSLTKSSTMGGNTDGSSHTVLTDIATGAVTGSLLNVNASSKDHVVQEAKSAILDVLQFGVVLHALREDAGAKQLSNPKIVVSSDEQATIHIGEQTPIVKSSTSGEDGDIKTYELDGDFGGQTFEEIELVDETDGKQKKGRMRQYTTPKGYLDLGTKLTVAPSVKTAEEIYVKVVPELVSQIQEKTFGDTRYPVLFSTRVNTEFTIRSGQTIAIGGLVNERTRTGESKVPVLGSLPLLGRAFRYETKERSQTETIIFLTVKITPSTNLTASAGVPVRAYLVQPELELIQQQDSEGAEYSPARARERLKKLHEAPGAAREPEPRAEVPAEPTPTLDLSSPTPAPVEVPDAGPDTDAVAEPATEEAPAPTPEADAATEPATEETPAPTPETDAVAEPATEETPAPTPEADAVAEPATDDAAE